MDTPQTIDVSLGKADGGVKIVSVRVVSMHSEDDAMRGDVYAHDEIALLIGEIRQRVGTIEAAKQDALVKNISELRLRRDQLERTLIEKCLSYKHKGEEIQTILRQCNSENIGFILLFNALCGIATPLSAPPAVSQPSVTNS